jgi:methylenetetrahydrofolate dehydrogenase (NADP+) / methenyltetrahydrofolate cyclohydrolase
MIIDGKAIAAELNAATRRAVTRLQHECHVTPTLAVVLVGEDPASQIYVRNKVLQAEAAGLRSIQHVLPVSTSADELFALIASLNAAPDVHGILVQLPLPAHIDETRVIDAIAPHKDVDGFHPLNAGALLNGDAKALVPCTPQGCMLLARRAFDGALAGKRAVVIGRSNIVGKPLAMLLVQADCTVTIAHSRTRNVAAVCREADLLCVAVGRAELVKAEWVKPGAVVIDVGINRVGDADRGYRVVGDVDFAAVSAVAAAITPVPGGVGPMTIACLLRNTVMAAARSAGVEGML